MQPLQQAPQECLEQAGPHAEIRRLLGDDAQGQTLQMWACVGFAPPVPPPRRGITLLLVAGVMYLLVRARKIRIFGAVDLHSDAGWTELKAAVAGMPRRAFGGAAPRRLR